VAGLKEIRRRIHSVQNTKQITRAMKLVSAAKLRRAQDAALNSRDFIERLNTIALNLVKDLPEGFSHPLLEQRAQVTRRCVVFVSGERGLCGPYNTNLYKALLRDQEETTVPTDYIPMGRRGVAVCNRMNWSTIAQYEGLGEDVNLWPVEEIGHAVMEGFSSGRYDEVVLYYTKFVSAMTQAVAKETLLPFESGSIATNSEASANTVGWELNPDAGEIFSAVVPLLVNSRIRQAAMESKASEHAARMTAMDAATNNAQDLIDRLKLFYNRARQSAITTELIDIVGGAEAVS